VIKRELKYFSALYIGIPFRCRHPACARDDHNPASTKREVEPFGAEVLKSGMTNCVRMKGRSMRRHLLPLAATAITALAIVPAQAQVDEVFETEAGPVQVSTVVGGLSNLWAIAFLPDGGMLVTEREGALRH